MRVFRILLLVLLLLYFRKRATSWQRQHAAVMKNVNTFLMCRSKIGSRDYRQLWRARGAATSGGAICATLVNTQHKRCEIVTQTESWHHDGRVKERKGTINRIPICYTPVWIRAAPTKLRRTIDTLVPWDKYDMNTLLLLIASTSTREWYCLPLL